MYRIDFFFTAENTTVQEINYNEIPQEPELWPEINRKDFFDSEKVCCLRSDLCKLASVISKKNLWDKIRLVPRDDREMRMKKAGFPLDKNLSEEEEQSLRLVQLKEYISDEDRMNLPLEDLKRKEEPMWCDYNCIKELSNDEEVKELDIYERQYWAFAILQMSILSREGWDAFKARFENERGPQP